MRRLALISFVLLALAAAQPATAKEIQSVAACVPFYELTIVRCR